MKLKNLYIALIATAAMTFWLPSHATEPAGVMVKQPVAQQSVSPLSKQAAQPVVHIKCPERVRFVMEVENVPGWGESKYSSGAKVERAGQRGDPLFQLESRGRRNGDVLEPASPGSGPCGLPAGEWPSRGRRSRVCR